MESGDRDRNETQVSLRPVDPGNWRDVANLEVSEDQREFVAQPAYYLSLCCYGGDWHPLAICRDEQVVGFMMWAVDPADGSCWLGGILIDRGMQRRGYGRRAVEAAIAMLSDKYGYTDFALSYQPANLVAKHLYGKIGFVETDEREDDEIVACLSLKE